MSSVIHTVSVAEYFPVDAEALWREAGHPALLSGAVPMLDAFTSPESLLIGAPLEETHTILGWRQRYAGEVLIVEEGKVWGMSSKPREFGPYSLPHDVFYRFTDHGAQSSLRITCRFECLGLLALPLAPKLVAWLMRLTLMKLFRVIRMRLHSQTAISAVVMSPYPHSNE